MKKFCVLLVLGLVAHMSLALNIRHKRQNSESANDLEDRYGWNRPNRFPSQGQQPQRPGNAGTTTQSPAIQACINNCLVTPEYNPICGTDNQIYTNAGRLACAQSCGVDVRQASSIRGCPDTTTNLLNVRLNTLQQPRP